MGQHSLVWLLRLQLGDGLEGVLHLGFDQAEAEADFSKTLLRVGSVGTEGGVIDELLELPALPEQVILDALAGLGVGPDLEVPQRLGIILLNAL